MSPRRTLAVARRLLEQFRRDRRTLVLLFVVPLVILSLLGYLLRGSATPPKVGVVGGCSVPVRSTSVTLVFLSRSAAEAQLKGGQLAAYVLCGPPPEIHLEGSQPNVNSTVLQALAPPRAEQPMSIVYLHGGSDFDTLDYFGAGFVGLVVFFLVFVVTSVAFLRERTSGTLERLLASPLRRAEIVVGYMLAFGVVALIQSAIVLVFSLYALRIKVEGNVGLVFLFEALLAVSAVNLGIFLSGFARTEFQAVQFIPLVIVPQMLLSGIVFPVVTEPGPLQPVSNVLPLTYGVYGLRDVMVKGSGLGDAALLLDLGVVLAFAVAVVAAAAVTLRRKIA